MNRIHRWLFGVALACFAAGVVVGRAWPELMAFLHGPEWHRDGEFDLLRRYVERYDLDAEQTRYLHAVLAEVRSEREKIFSDPQNLPPELRSRYETALRRTDRLIYEILDERQREKYRADNQPDSPR